MRVLLFLSDQNRPTGHCGQPLASALPPPPLAKSRGHHAWRLLSSSSSVFLLLIGTSCEPGTPAKTAHQAPPIAKPSVQAQPPSLPPPPAPTPAANPSKTAGAVAATDTLAKAGRRDSATGATLARAAAVPAKPKAAAKPKGPVVRDTIGNALAARLLGGPFDVTILRYRRDPATPLMLKLVPRTTLMVGVNSSESRLYRLFAGAPVPPAMLARPLALDRLAFEPGQAVLGAEAAQQLGNLAALLRTFPKVSLRLSGHSATTEPLFWKLGNARGRACLAELLKQGIAPARLHTEWLAPQPKDPHPQGLSVRVITR